LRYRHVLRGDSDKPQLIADIMGYNSNAPSQSGQGPSNWVGDLLLECEVVIDKAEGELVLELSRSSDRFQAVWDLSTGRCTLKRLADGKEPVALDSTATKVGKGKYSLRFANVDRRLTLWVGNSVVEWSGGKPGVDYDAPNGEKPTNNDLQPASIGADKAAVRVQGLKLWRDTYYTVGASDPDLGNITDSEWGDPDAWKSKTLPFRTLYVQPGHFLCLGDNSPQSSDGRNWGLVPERLLLGRAQVVYYPFYFPWWPLSSQVNRVGLIR
jgi:signal peptidase I